MENLITMQGISITKYTVTSKNIEIRKTPLYLGVDLRNFSYVIKEKLSSIVFVGGLIKRKRVDELIDLARQYSNIQFKIIGEGSEQQRLQNKATDNVLFLGGLSHKEIDLIFSSSDLLFLPSKSEGFPKVILETASAGVSSMVYNDYGADEWINNNKNGFILSNKDEVVAKIKELIDNPELLISNAKEALKLAEQFSWTVQIIEWEKTITNLK